MSTEFTAKNGLISKGNTQVTGTLTVSQGITSSLGVFTTSSWANNAISSSFASTVITSSFSINSGTASTASFASVVITASYALLSTSASFASTVITSSFSNNSGLASTSSFASVVVTSSFATNAGTSATSSWTLASPATTLNTASTYQITASQAVSASFSPGGAAATYTSSLFGTASWANSSITSSILVTANLSASVPSYAPGVLFYDTASATFSYYNDDPLVTMNLGQESWIKIYNSGSTTSNYISNSYAVYLSGSFNNIPTAWLAIADGTGTKFNVAGVATENIQTASYGYITTNGTVHNIPGFNFTAGSQLWLSTTVSGSYQTTQPTGVNEKVSVGFVLTSGSATGGSNFLVDQNEHTFGSITASYAINSSTSSYNSQIIFGYTTDITSSTNWITASFNNSNQQVNLTTALAYSFTQSNMPASNQVSDLFLYISHSAAATSSLSFPSTWRNIGTGWPTTINANTVGALWLRAIDANNVIGTYNVSGSQLSASYAATASWAVNAINGGTSLSTGSTYPITSSWANNSITSSFASTVVTSSFSLNVTTSSYASNYTRELTTGSTYSITSSWATNVNSSSVSATSTNTLFFFDLSTGSSGYQPTYVNTTLTFNPSTNQISGSNIGITSSFNGNITGSNFGTSSWSNKSITSSFAVTQSFIQTSFTTASLSSSWATSSYTSSNGFSAAGYATYTGLGAMTTQTYNCAFTRSAVVGQYWVSFNTALATNNYVVTSNGFSGSSANVLAPTASVLMAVKQTTTGFTMSVVKLSAAVPPAADFNTASFTVFNY